MLFKSTVILQVTVMCINEYTVDVLLDGDEVTSQSLWSRYDRHFMGMTRYSALSKWRIFLVLFK